MICRRSSSGKTASNTSRTSLPRRAVFSSRIRREDHASVLDTTESCKGSKSIRIPVQSRHTCVDGIDIDAIALPAGWQDRLVVVENPNTNGYRGLCLDPGDLAVAKLVAYRQKDLDFVRVMLREGLVQS